MKTLTIELAGDAAEMAEARARRAKMSVEEWVASRITGLRGGAMGERDSMGYPKDWFERTTGSLADVDIREPEDPPFRAIPAIDL